MTQKAVISHYDEAERLLAEIDNTTWKSPSYEREALAKAQVHATLAIAAHFRR